MSKPRTEEELSFQLDSDLTWRRRELSDLKAAINNADDIARAVLLRALVAMTYAHWEGYIRNGSMKYFEHITLKKRSYQDLDAQFYLNSFLVRLNSFFKNKGGTEESCKFISSILNSRALRFSYINPQLIDTKSNLSTDVIKDLCIVCGFESQTFEAHRQYIDVVLLKRRNAIAHGQDEGVGFGEMEGLIDTGLALMGHFKTLIENKIYTKAYLLGATNSHSGGGIS